MCLVYILKCCLSVGKAFCVLLFFICPLFGLIWIYLYSTYYYIFMLLLYILLCLNISKCNVKTVAFSAFILWKLNFLYIYSAFVGSGVFFIFLELRLLRENKYVLFCKHYTKQKIKYSKNKQLNSCQQGLLARILQKVINPKIYNNIFWHKLSLNKIYSSFLSLPAYMHLHNNNSYKNTRINRNPQRQRDKILIRHNVCFIKFSNMYL